MSSKEYQVWIVAMFGQWRREKLVISAVRGLNGFIGEDQGLYQQGKKHIQRDRWKTVNSGAGGEERENHYLALGICQLRENNALV